MAASTNTNQIALTNSDITTPITVTGEVVLLKYENLTLTSATTDEAGTSHPNVDFSNYGNYKALKVTDTNGHTQYIVSMKGEKDVFFSIKPHANGGYKRYPIYDHSMELSEADFPLNDFEDRDPSNNALFLYDGSLGGGQSRNQYFKDIYQAENSSGTFVDYAKFDVMKGAMVGDTVSCKILTGNQIRVYKTSPGNIGDVSTIHQDGRLVSLSGNSDIYSYLFTEITLVTNALRVDTAKTQTAMDTGGMWGVRPGLLKLDIGTDTADSDNKVGIQLQMDVRGFDPSYNLAQSELGFTSSDTHEWVGGIQLIYTDVEGTTYESEEIPIQRDTPGWDKSSRIVLEYNSTERFGPGKFPIDVRVSAVFGTVGFEYYQDTDSHFWSEYDSDYGSIDATNPDITTGELLNDPWCIDRSFTDECVYQASGDLNPWQTYVMQVDYETNTQTSAPSGNKVYADNVVNTKINYGNAGSVTTQGLIIGRSNDVYAGMSNTYLYKSKTFRISVAERANMIRTISMTYNSNTPITMTIYTDGESKSKDVFFEATTPTGVGPTYAQMSTNTKVVGLSAKDFCIRLYANQGLPNNIDIRKISIGYG